MSRNRFSIVLGAVAVLAVCSNAHAAPLTFTNSNSTAADRLWDTTTANWKLGAVDGQLWTPNDGTTDANIPQLNNVPAIQINAHIKALGITFAGNTKYTTQNSLELTSGSLTIGANGITETNSTYASPIAFAPILAADQEWNFKKRGAVAGAALNGYDLTISGTSSNTFFDLTAGISGTGNVTVDTMYEFKSLGGSVHTFSGTWDISMKDSNRLFTIASSSGTGAKINQDVILTKGIFDLGSGSDTDYLASTINFDVKADGTFKWGTFSETINTLNLYTNAKLDGSGQLTVSALTLDDGSPLAAGIYGAGDLTGVTFINGATVKVLDIPEPASFILVMVGAASIIGRRRV